ncbi:MAG: ankyrin repeat domain-containing protein [Ignavibacteriota bacterium]
MEHGADVNAQSKMGRTPLLIASSTDGALATVQLLIAHGARGDVRDASSLRRFWPPPRPAMPRPFAIWWRAAPTSMRSNNYGMTPLMWAAATAIRTRVRLLLAHGADAKAVSNEEVDRPSEEWPDHARLFHPLLLAAPYGGEELAKTLLDAGARRERPRRARHDRTDAGHRDRPLPIRALCVCWWSGEPIATSKTRMARPQPIGPASLIGARPWRLSD